MGRQCKAGLDYFELDCHMEEKVRLIQAEYGLKGFAILVKLYQKIYGEFGYYCEFNDDSLLLFMSENGIGEGSEKNLIKEIVQACIRRNIFSAEIYNKYGVLTSVGVQKRYLAATSKRDFIELKKEYLLVSDGKNRKNVVINSIYDGRNAISDGRNSQSREEKSREENSKEKNKDIPVSDETASASKAKHKYGEYGHVFLSDEERDRLFNDYGEAETLKAIKYLDDYIEMKGYKCKSHNLALRKWVFKALKEEELRERKFNGNLRSGRQQTGDGFLDGIADWVSKNQEGGTNDGCGTIW